MEYRQIHWHMSCIFLAETYSPFGEETRLEAMTGIFHFDRRSGESIDDLLTGFDIARQVAVSEGGVGANTQALSWFLLKAIRPTGSQLLQLALRYQTL